MAYPVKKFYMNLGPIFSQVPDIPYLTYSSPPVIPTLELNSIVLASQVLCEINFTSLLFLPENMHFLGLSAYPMPN